MSGGASGTPDALQFLQSLQSQPGRQISRLSGSVLVDLDYEQDIRLRKVYAMGVLIGLGVQLAIADTLVFLYAGIGVHWNVHTSVLQVWLAATVVEVLGVVLVVTRNLFPRRDSLDSSLAV